MRVPLQFFHLGNSSLGQSKYVDFGDDFGCSQGVGGREVGKESVERDFFQPLKSPRIWNLRIVFVRIDAVDGNPA